MVIALASEMLRDFVDGRVECFEERFAIQDGADDLTVWAILRPLRKRIDGAPPCLLPLRTNRCIRS
jgi:hypothetical protein